MYNNEVYFNIYSCSQALNTGYYNWQTAVNYMLYTALNWIKKSIHDHEQNGRYFSVNQATFTSCFTSAILKFYQY